MRTFRRDTATPRSRLRCWRVSTRCWWCRRELSSAPWKVGPPPCNATPAFLRSSYRSSRPHSSSRCWRRAAFDSAFEKRCERTLHRFSRVSNSNGDTLGAVSYTHLRAHETPEHLVCRLLLEKKKK